MQLNNKITYCSSDSKLEDNNSICSTCRRNIDQWNITNDTNFEDFIPSTTKNFGTKQTSPRCNGYIKGTIDATQSIPNRLLEENRHGASECR